MMTLRTRCNDDQEPTLELSQDRSKGPWRIVIGDEDHGRSILLSHGRTMVVGSARGVDLRVSDRWVSGRHCRLEASRGGVIVEDLGSKNGVLLGQGHVARALVGTGGAFVIGRTLFAVERPGTDACAEDARPVPGLVGASRVMLRVAADVRRCAALRAPVLIHGESGTGKDVVARAIHELSGRRGAHLPLNVGAIPESLVDAELFGHRRGAFTGAVDTRAGAFEQAHTGTLFLDEVAELSAAGQVRLLRVIEDGTVRPLGASRPLSVDVRLVSASWANLPDLVASGRFRGDLYHRLSTFVIELPPLRTRTGDLGVLSRTLLERHRDELGPKQLTPAALARLVVHDWPGNVRELSSVLYRAAARSEGEWIQASHLDFGLAPASPRRAVTMTPHEAVRLAQQHGNNVSAAARAAGVPRSTFRSWLSRASTGDSEATLER
jgi:DNA-binding NtrC family response regulator